MLHAFQYGLVKDATHTTCVDALRLPVHRCCQVLKPHRRCAHQALRMMRGMTTAGPGLVLAREGAVVQPAPGVHVPHLSLGSLRAILQRFARAATHAIRSECWFLAACLLLPTPCCATADAASQPACRGSDLPCSDS